MADTRNKPGGAGTEAPAAFDQPQGLQLAEVMVLTTLHERVQRPADALSGHALRHELQDLGVAKGEATLAIQSLVANGLVARVRCDDPDGRFYTAYRLTDHGEAWLRAHGDRDDAAADDVDAGPPS